MLSISFHVFRLRIHCMPRRSDSVGVHGVHGIAFLAHVSLLPIVTPVASREDRGLAVLW